VFGKLRSFEANFDPSPLIIDWAFNEPIYQSYGKNPNSFQTSWWVLYTARRETQTKSLRAPKQNPKK
jgi:hypothetical protein